MQDGETLFCAVSVCFLCLYEILWQKDNSLPVCNLAPCLLETFMFHMSDCIPFPPYKKGEGARGIQSFLKNGGLEFFYKKLAVS